MTFQTFTGIEYLQVDIAMTEFSSMRPFALVPENAAGTGE